MIRNHNWIIFTIRAEFRRKGSTKKKSILEKHLCTLEKKEYSLLVGFLNLHRSINLCTSIDACTTFADLVGLEIDPLPDCNHQITQGDDSRLGIELTQQGVEITFLSPTHIYHLDRKLF